MTPPARPILVQYWHAQPPAEVQELMDTWRTADDEGFEYACFNDESALQFIRRHYDERTEKAYRSCAVPAMKADLFRICALLVRPGIYVDADMRRTGKGERGFFRRDESKPLRPFFQTLKRGILFRREDRVANGFIVVRNSNDNLLRAILNIALNNIEKKISNNVYVVTGPGVATKLFKAHGADHEYFRGFEFWSQDDLMPYMRMVGNLPYKRSDDHWVTAQSKRTIFVDG